MFKNLPSGLYPSFMRMSQYGWPPSRHWLLAGVCAIVFAVLMPREEAFPYIFQQGQPWSYRSLNAPFDFEVLHPVEEVRDELERVKAEHAPYFRLNPEVSRQQKKQFTHLVEEQIRISKHDTQFEDLVHNQSAYLAFGNQLLDRIFSRGIANPSEEAFKDTPGFIYIIAGNMERKVPVQEVVTLNIAYNFLTDTLPFSPLRQPELILPMLEKSLAVNMQYSDSLTIAYKRRKLAAITGTGIMVHKGEEIIAPGEIVSADVEQKIQSLKSRYHSDTGPFASAGTGWLAFLAFAALLWSVHREAPGDMKTFPFLSITALLLCLGAGWLGRVGESVPLLLPFWSLPLLLRQPLGSLSVGKIIWMLVLFLTAISFNWTAAWLTFQIAGYLGAQFFLEKQYRWKARLTATSGIWLLQLLVLAGLSLSGQLPANMVWTEAATFLLMGTLFSLTVFPLRRVLEAA